ncbi:uncharacterized protein BT62DRAFT_993972 [Guyanagaster necrorhizus]|uniref:Uncharacterized protein n=1 Tax=Guyanagaster necrorhizus TaxID=856835 RepID=A0A9P7VRX1_9AGAR|nr:uncharacterized protein BT62DRAFT_993972 [Guyanagaster necrorhizus MCA 3950]KAG7446308.1 hypothetical protein BT62DRAFT_993972 [Guyanagaster necrorhizus MCA 3950]
MASAEELVFNDPHPPHPNAILAFGKVLGHIKFEILKSRKDWDKHEPKMWSRARGITNDDLVAFNLEDDLVLVRSAPTSYGTIILGKIRIPAINDDEGEGYIHVRRSIHDPPGGSTDDVRFHSLFTDEGNKNADGQATTWRAIQTKDTALEFFNE